MRKLGILSGTLLLGLILAGCADREKEESPSASVIGNFHDVTADSTDTTPFKILTVIPKSNQPNVDPQSPLIFFTNDKLDKSSINDESFRVTAFQDQKLGIFTGTLTDAGNTVLIFTPYHSLPEFSNITVSIPTKTETTTTEIVDGFVIENSTDYIKDKGGNAIESEFSYSFQAGRLVTDVTANSENLAFENGLTEEFRCGGDCGLLTEFGDGPPVSGNGLYISSGSNMVTQEQAALNGETSTLLMYGVSSGNYLNFTYNFISLEFDEFVGSQFDDSFIVTARGPKGVVVSIVDTVNQIGAAASTPGTFPAWTGDSDTPEESGNKNISIDISAAGHPANVTFIVSNVGDTAYPTVIMVDNISFTDSASYSEATTIVGSLARSAE